MILNKIHENIKKNIILWEYMVFSQDDRNLIFYNTSRFYPLNYRSWKNVSRTPKSPDDASPRVRAFLF